MAISSRFGLYSALALVVGLHGMRVGRSPEHGARKRCGGRRGRMWDEQFQPLAQVFRVIRYDHRGFGKSSAPEKPYSPVSDLVKIMDHLKIPRVNLVGNSMGGTLALDFALVHPDGTGAVVVIASTAGGYPDTEEDRQRVMAVLSAARERGTGRARQDQ
jgi:pimeloyl-ACP methyl ester carboxylesterase